MHVLIVGAGISGSTLASLLYQRGISFKIIEKAESFNQAGYVISLWPMGSRLLHGLHLYEAFVKASVPLDVYEVRKADNTLLHTYKFDEFSNQFGQIRSILRSKLITILHDSLPDNTIYFGKTISSLSQNEKVHVTFNDGLQEDFDLVVGADGIHSQVRDLVFNQTSVNDTGWSGYAFWVNPELTKHTKVTEYWGDAHFFGVYPEKDKLCCFTAVPTERIKSDPISFLKEEYGYFKGSVPTILKQLNDPSSIYYTKFVDIKLKQWVKGRVILIGDAGQGILPTAGVGASMAMESAAVLADELSRVDAKTIPLALSLFVKRRRKRIDKVQGDSRLLAKLSLCKTKSGSYFRNIVLKHYSQKALNKNFYKVINEAI